MKNIVFFTFVLLFLGSCQDQERERRLKKKEVELTQKEQALLLRENALALREQSIAKEVHVLDSTRQASLDSTQYNPTGVWAARMNCIETDCPGSAIGDSKNEQWEISYQQSGILVQASVNNRIVRLYTGTLTGNTLTLNAQHTDDEALPDANTNITVQLQAATEQRLEGQRIIERPGNCRIIYALELTKK
ncbi:hypothetical protein MUN82_05620 [Hymenobacter aerilatus]|uniref:Lipoprotein n=1 Tax=Hymenobacter aerilatus TaxID=2932251 RepID=A0A8T9T062_9BACT|nr:hypothetical protein [Hymenobacter aerilatus]UOR06574.1 hypothetical protein MUN82_05620 [Hymenobacter aerilatus]